MPIFAAHVSHFREEMGAELLKKAEVEPNISERRWGPSFLKKLKWSLTFQ